MRTLLVAVAFVGCSPPAVAPPAPAPKTAAAPAGFLKGQLHLHTGASGDSETPAADVVKWYADAGFDFIVFTDHNMITEHAGHGSMLTFPGIELTQNLERCDPPPEPGLACLLHVNGLFVDPARAGGLASMPRPEQPERVALYAHGMKAAQTLGGLAMLDHPNFHYAANAELIGSLAAAGLRFFELANEAVDSNNGGDAKHPSTEALWDAVLTQGHTLYGVATDDAHHYYDADAVRAAGHLAHVGNRGWVMVKAEPNEAAIRSALSVGEFYSTNGLLLTDVRREAGHLIIEAATEVTTTFIGEGGRVLDTVEGARASIEIPKGYVRARVQNAAGQTAWTQPARL